MAILVSACLMGVNCKYNGGNNLHRVISGLQYNVLIPVCPEQLGGLTTPRKPAEIQGGEGKCVLEGKAKVITNDGDDVTKAFIKGASETLYIAKEVNAKLAILKARSPSCGIGEIYNGSFSSKLKKGDGVTTALLKQHKINIYNEINYKKLNLQLH
ncbi:DUF523 domain-containing protein [Serpentinicella sp. ANB-PHB4]|uniref:DUF523 domain-containing protein n=1 Tax=Serpentinicella sp. ANB-PHB4 TaxID=3074076 RepID=UPI002854AD0E|nr:DUF523 domain-containing protein [Serpentinicella sp. ANB-PHB4]MDR5659615.1 DUF523 domain-containing protein [Serpentinicella sp. ANB-PHB4]